MGSTTFTLAGFERAELTGGVSANMFTFGDVTIPSVTVDGGGASDTIRSGKLNTQWSIGFDDNLANAGSLDEKIVFASIENLTGGSGTDAFKFIDGGSVSGAIDGAGGENSLDYDEYTTPIVVNLRLHTATGSGSATNILTVAGGSDDDSLYGPALDAVWRVTGENEGTIDFDATADSVRFKGIENLFGADATRDDFIINAGGSLGGTLHGGASSVDTLVVQDNSDDEAFILVNVGSSAAGSFTAYGRTVAFSGIEPIVSGTATDRVIAGSSLPDRLRIESVDATTLRVVSGDLEIYDVGTRSVIRTIAFANPVSLVVSLGGGNDQLEIGALAVGLSTAISFDGAPATTSSWPLISTISGPLPARTAARSMARWRLPTSKV